MASGLGSGAGRMGVVGMERRGMSDERLPRKAVLWLNRELAAQGLRVCIKCGGHPQPLDAEHFYPVRAGSAAYENTCKACRKAREAERFRERYWADAAYRARRRAATNRWRAERRDYLLQYERERLPRRKAARIARVLGKAGSP